MKNIKYIKLFILGVIISMAFVSCEDLEEEPLTFLTKDNAINSIQGVDVAMHGVYDVWSTGFVNHMFRWAAMSGPSQYTVCRSGSTHRDGRYVSYDWDPSDGFFTTRLWDIYYQAIQRANILIERIPEIGLDQTLAENRIAEARFIRAEQYFWLVRLYGDVPLHLKATLEVNDEILSGKSLPRSPMSEVYDVIIEDLKYAEDRLPLTRIAAENGRPTSGAAKAMLGKVYLQMAGKPMEKTEYYQMAADKLLEVVTDGQYELLSDYAAIFDNTNEFNKEVVYALPVVADNETRNILAWALTPPGLSSFGGFNEWGFTEAFYNSFDPKDTRRDVTLIYSYTTFDGKEITFNAPWPEGYKAPRGLDAYNDNTGIGFGKFIDEGATSNLAVENDHILIRYADVLLSLAEAYIGAGKPDLALPYINQIRARAFGEANDLTETNGAALLELLKQERAWELAGEYTEYHDLQRWGDVKKAMEEGPQVTQTYNKKYELMPLPTNALEFNSNLKQNEGW